VEGAVRRLTAWWRRLRAHRLDEIAHTFRSNLVQRWRELRSPMTDQDENRRGKIRDRLKDLDRK
jgi:hypothetical protein